MKIRSTFRRKLQDEKEKKNRNSEKEKKKKQKFGEFSFCDFDVLQGYTILPQEATRASPYCYGDMPEFQTKVVHAFQVETPICQKAYTHT